jgi:glycosyltransferase involved in cell wall biosynthesis
VYLVLAGDGPLDEYVNEHKSDHIIPVGRLEYQDVISLLVESDIFCMPSFSEGFSTSVLEAVACNCYVVTTERGGSKEIIVSKDYGTIIKNNKEKLVYDALVEIIDDDSAREKACKNSYDKLINEFTWEVTTDKVIKIANK